MYQELTEPMKDRLNYCHSAVLIFTPLEHKTCKASAAPGAASSISSADKCHPLWHHCLGKPSRDSRSANMSHLKAVTQNTLTGQILVHRNLWLASELWVLSQRCSGLTLCVSTVCFKTQAHLHHFLCFNSAVFPISFNCFLHIAAQHLPLQQQHKLHPELS